MKKKCFNYSQEREIFIQQSENYYKLCRVSVGLYQLNCQHFNYN